MTVRYGHPAGQATPEDTSAASVGTTAGLEVIPLAALRAASRSRGTGPDRPQRPPVTTC